MASVNEILGIDSYRGDPNAGNGFGTVVTIDPTPIQRFSTFKFYSDQAKWEQKNKDDANAAKQIADIAAYDINSPLTPYSDALKTKLKDIQEFTRQNPNALVYGRDPEGFQNLQKKINDFSNLRKSAAASDAIYAAGKTAIDVEPDLSKKTVMQKDLDIRVKELFDGGVDKAQQRILASTSPPKPDDYKTPAVKITSYDVLGKGDNEIYNTHYKFINKDQLDADAELTVAGFNKPALDETTPAFQALSPERQQLERDKSKISGLQRQNIVDLSNNFNNLLSQWKAAHPDQDITQIKGAPTGDTLTDNIKAANKYNDQIDQLNGLITAGKLKDPTGKVLTKLFTKYNLADGLSPAEIVSMHSLQASGDSIWDLTKTVTSTNDATEAQADATRRRGQDLDLLNSREGRAAAAALAKAKESKGGGKEDQPITDVAEYMLGHIGRIAGSLNSQNKTQIDVNYNQADDYIRSALNLGPTAAEIKNLADGKKESDALSDSDGAYYRQYKDGKIEVYNKNNRRIESLNLNILKQRIAQKLHGTKTGDIDPVSQKAIEKGFGGIVDLDKILSEEIKSPAQKNATAAPSDNSGYSQVTETEQGVTVGVKNGKWYDIKTGKEYK